MDYVILIGSIIAAIGLILFNDDNKICLGVELGLSLPYHE